MMRSSGRAPVAECWKNINALEERRRAEVEALQAAVATAGGAGRRVGWWRG